MVALTVVVVVVVTVVAVAAVGAPTPPQQGLCRGRPSISAHQSSLLQSYSLLQLYIPAVAGMI